MSDVWHPMFELTGTADNPDDTIEAAEEYGEQVGEDQRVVMVEAGDGDTYTPYVEKRFSDGGGYVQIGAGCNPDEDYAEVMIDMVDEWETNDVRLVYNYTDGGFVLEQWVEP